MVLPMNHNPLIDRLTKFPIYFRLIGTVNPAQHQSWTGTHIALVLIRPFHKLNITITRFHLVTSRTAAP